MWKPMRNAVLAFLGAAMVAAGAASCGGGARDPAAKTASTASLPSNAVPDAHAHVIAPAGFVKYDGDSDVDDRGSMPSKEDEQEMVHASRHGASPADRREIAAVVKAYIATATRGDSATACSLLARSLARSVGQDGKPAASSGCQAELSRLFAQQHAHLAVEEAATMVVTGAHVQGNVGFATLGFRKAVESELLLRREGGRWKVDALFDSILP
jgi:hypothetical protein